MSSTWACAMGMALAHTHTAGRSSSTCACHGGGEGRRRGRRHEWPRRRTPLPLPPRPRPPRPPRPHTHTHTNQPPKPHSPPHTSSPPAPTHPPPPSPPTRIWQGGQATPLPHSGCGGATPTALLRPRICGPAQTKKRRRSVAWHTHQENARAAGRERTCTAPRETKRDRDVRGANDATAAEHHTPG